MRATARDTVTAAGSAIGGGAGATYGPGGVIIGGAIGGGAAGGAYDAITGGGGGMSIPEMVRYHEQLIAEEKARVARDELVARIDAESSSLEPLERWIEAAQDAGIAQTRIDAALRAAEKSLDAERAAGVDLDRAWPNVPNRSIRRLRWAWFVRDLMRASGVVDRPAPARATQRVVIRRTPVTTSSDVAASGGSSRWIATGVGALLCGGGGVYIARRRKRKSTSTTIAAGAAGAVMGGIAGFLIGGKIG